MVAGRIYTVQESDIPNLYHVGLLNLVGKKMKINKNDYYKLILDSSEKKRVPHHTDINTGKLYEFVPKSDVIRYTNQYESIKGDLELIDKGDIKPITHDQVDIKNEIAGIVNEVKVKDYTNQLVHEDNAKLNKLRVDESLNTVKNVFDIATEPIQAAGELVKRGSEKLGDNVNKLGSSPVFLLGAAAAGIIALKILI